MTSRKVRQILLSMAVGAALVFGLYAVNAAIAPDAKADSDSYLQRLSELGYEGPVYKWLGTANYICDAELRGVPQSLIASTIVWGTGSGIYTPEAYEIIDIANDELCYEGELYA